jgi:hypothetical protein
MPLAGGYASPAIYSVCGNEGYGENIGEILQSSTAIGDLLTAKS